MNSGDPPSSVLTAVADNIGFSDCAILETHEYLDCALSHEVEVVGGVDLVDLLDMDELACLLGLQHHLFAVEADEAIHQQYLLEYLIQALLHRERPEDHNCALHSTQHRKVLIADAGVLARVADAP